MFINAKNDKCRAMRHWLLPRFAHVSICGVDSAIENNMYTTCKTVYKARQNFRLRLAAMYGYPVAYIKFFIDELICTGNAKKEHSL